MIEEEYNKLTYRQTLAYHDELRNSLYELVTKEFASLGISLRSITYKDVQEADGWKTLWRKEDRAASWNWTDMYHNYQSRSGARRLDLAITKPNKLLGLCYGMLERNRLILKVHAMEANPQHRALAGHMLEITLFSARIYADINGASEIWLCDPVSPAHVRLYQGRGYTPYYDRFDRCTHLMRKIK